MAELTIKKNVLTASLKRLDHIEIPAGVTEIAAGALQRVRMRTITIPAGLRIVGEGAFRDCRYLQGICVENEALLDSQLLRARNAVYCLIWTVNRIF